MPSYTILYEENEWEGETWTHAVATPTDENLAAALALVCELPLFTFTVSDEPPPPYDTKSGYISEVAVFDSVAPGLLLLVEDADQDELERKLYKGRLRGYLDHEVDLARWAELVGRSARGEKTAPARPVDMASVTPRPLSTWIDDEGCFARGKYGPSHEDGPQPVEEVAWDDASYLSWILSDTDICDEDAAILREHLRRAGR